MNLALAVAAAVLAAGVTSLSAADKPPAKAGDTIVAKWKDGKKAVFLLAFDDSCASHLKNAIPELDKRKLVGTFYINPGNGPFQGQAKGWADAARSPAVVLANHTFKHEGALSVEQLDRELSQANDTIHQLHPDRKPPYLISFGQPGGVPWKVEKEEVNKLFEKYNLVNRPPFHGPPFTQKTLDEAFKLIDDTIQKGEMEHLDFHGVGGDWHVVPMDYYIPMLDRLVERQDQLWVTDHISFHKYQHERKSAAISVIETTDSAIRLRLTCTQDPALYDAPLTLQTAMPAGWKECNVTQGKSQRRVTVTNSLAQYEALPGDEIIVLTPGR